MTKTFIGCAAVNFRRGRPPGFQPEAIVTSAGTLNVVYYVAGCKQVLFIES
jgi:hypothetical protein